MIFMKKLSFVLLIIGMVLYGVYHIFVLKIKQSYDGQISFSSNIDLSRKRGLYIGEYSPINKRIVIKGDTIDLLNAWCEHRFSFKTLAFKGAVIEKEYGYNFYIPTNDEFGQMSYSLNSIEGSNSGGRNRCFVSLQSNLLDTLTFSVEVKKENSWVETFIQDTVSFVKTKNTQSILREHNEAMCPSKDTIKNE